MNITYIISSFQGAHSGTGGHYYSCLRTAEYFSKFGSAQIINVGNFPATALNGSSVEINYVACGAADLVTFLPRLNAAIRPTCDVVHAFDVPAALPARLLAAMRGIPWVLTKAGMGDFAYHPIAPEIIIFAEENRLWFDERRRFSRSQIHCIPNREAAVRNVSTIANDTVGKAGAWLDKKDRLTLIVICTLRPEKATQIAQAVNLHRFLLSRDIKNRLAIVGRGNRAVAEEIVGGESRHIAIFSDPDSTTMASKHLPKADIAVAAGRGTIEALMEGRIVFVASDASPMPVLLTQETFTHMAYHNFSRRHQATTSIEALERDFLPLLRDEVARSTFTEKLRQLAVRTFDISQVEDGMREIYSRPSRRASFVEILDTFANAVYFIFSGPFRFLFGAKRRTQSVGSE